MQLFYSLYSTEHRVRHSKCLGADYIVYSGVHYVCLWTEATGRGGWFACVNWISELLFLISQAQLFENALYEIDWINMTIENKKLLLIIMAGSQRMVTIRAGGTYELNLALFAQVILT